MKGVGGPLLCIGDLLSDLAEKEEQESPPPDSPPPPSSPSPFPGDSRYNFTNSNLTLLFQENFARLNEAFAGTDHSWTVLTLKLCSALENANKLIQSTNSNVELLSEKVGHLETIIERGNAAVAQAKALHACLCAKNEGHSGRQ